MSKNEASVCKGARTETCCICGTELPVYINDKGEELAIGLNNPEPLNNEAGAVCCDTCDVLVTAARLIPKFGGNAVRAMESALGFHAAKDKAKEAVAGHVR